jgi:hypothetical protein
LLLGRLVQPQHPNDATLLEVITRISASLESAADRRVTFGIHTSSNSKEDGLSSKRANEEVGILLELRTKNVLMWGADDVKVEIDATEGGMLTSSYYTVTVNASKLKKELRRAQARAKLQTALNSAEVSEVLTPASYDVAAGTLWVRGEPVQIILQKNRLGQNHVLEPKAATVLRLLFKDVNSLSRGVKGDRILSVAKAKLDKKKRALIKNYVDECNRKIKAQTGIPDLLGFEQNTVFVTPYRLKK